MIVCIIELGLYFPVRYCRKFQKANTKSQAPITEINKKICHLEENILFLPFVSLFRRYMSLVFGFWKLFGIWKLEHGIFIGICGLPTLELFGLASTVGPVIGIGRHEHK